jgi:hypothetical protein
MEALTRKERQQRYAEMNKREAERKAAQARFKPSPVPLEVRRKAREKEHAAAMRRKLDGTTPWRPRQLGPVSGLANLIAAGADQANADEVHGRNERERSQLPNRPLTPGRYEAPQRPRSPKPAREKSRKPRYVDPIEKLIQESEKRWAEARKGA